VADLVDEHRAAVAAYVLIRPEHEVVENQLPSPLEEVDEGRLPSRPVEDVVLLDSNHWQPAALGSERVSFSRGLFLLGQERVVRFLPLGRRDNGR
jgi:hypothetical protein